VQFNNQANKVISMPVLVFVAVIFFFIVQNSHAYHFNPLLGFFGYHFYEVGIEGGITYVLITKQNISDCKSITKVVQLTEYMIMDVSHA
jgi:small neutral amino acid transporter SnatA (MarC family)